MEYFGDARHHDLDADAEREECDHFIDDDAAVVADFSDDLLSLCKKQVEDRAHQYDDDGDDRVVEQATDPVAADAGRSHHRENDRDAAGADADWKGNGIEYPGFDRPQTDGVGVSFRYAAGRSVGVAEPLQRRATDEQAAAQLDDRRRQVEEREYEMPDGQTSQADQQVVGDDSSMMDMRVFWSSPDKNPFTRNPAPTGFATGNSAIKEDMNMKIEPLIILSLCYR